MPGTPSNRIFHGKLLLFGEHSVIEGSKALVIPFRSVSAQLDFRHENQENFMFRESNMTLRRFAAFMEESGKKNPDMPPVNLNALQRDIDEGLYFRSTIPSKYGLGSSGALCAAIYNEYGPDNEHRVTGESSPLPSDLQPVRNSLAAMESYFHGLSSGVDPLCIYYDKSLIIEGKNKVVPWETGQRANPDIKVFLLDTGLTGDTGEYVEFFRQKLREPGIKESFDKQYIPYLNQMVDQFTEGTLSFELLVQLSVFQWNLFFNMIPDGYHAVWEYGLNSEYYVCKLCGSGGGGYILGFCEDLEKAGRSLTGRFNIKPIFLYNLA